MNLFAALVNPNGPSQRAIQERSGLSQSPPPRQRFSSTLALSGSRHLRRSRLLMVAVRDEQPVRFPMTEDTSRIAMHDTLKESRK